ncbi:MAG: secretion protein HlyD [Planctomycetota bacterium]|nr:MAG: secretion protein HlyD [Planctomycetota bacterium]
MLLLLAAATCPLTGCREPRADLLQGYVEGEFLYVGAPRAGQIVALAVARGTQVKKGDLLFALEDTSEQAAESEAHERLAEARARLADARKGRRPSEIESLEAQLKQAQAALALSEREMARIERLVGTGSVTEEEFDRVRSSFDQNRQRVAQLLADVETARLGARVDQIAAAEANVAALEAALERAQWELNERRQTAPRSGMTFDVLYRPGEWAPAGSPVVALLPPENIKVRFFVPEPRIGEVRVGDEVRVFVDGVPEPAAGRVSFISPRAEYTPPVIYSRQSRQKLVFMVEAAFEPEVAETLHPGQPVDVRLR